MTELFTVGAVFVGWVACMSALAWVMIKVG